MPLGISFCQLVLRDGVFPTRNSAHDDRLEGHPFKGVMVAYHGVPIPSPRGGLLGTLCHFDVLAQSLSDAEFENLRGVARILSAFRLWRLACFVTGALLLVSGVGPDIKLQGSGSSRSGQSDARRIAAARIGSASGGRRWRSSSSVFRVPCWPCHRPAGAPAIAQVALAQRPPALPHLRRTLQMRFLTTSGIDMSTSNKCSNTDDSASMNIWLHRQVMNKVAANGGKVPDDLKD